MELRRHQRVPVHCPITFLGGAGPLRGGHVVNLSVAGCTVESNESAREGDYLSLMVQVPDQGAPTGVYKAQVRWSRGKKFGVEFLRMPSEARERIRRNLRAMDRAPGREGILHTP